MRLLLAFVIFAASIQPAHAEQLRAAMYLIDAADTVVPAGEVLLADSPDGARMLVDLHRLTPGSYRLSIHLGGDCGPGPDDTGGMAAGVLAGDLWTPADGVGESGMASDQPPPDAGTSTTPPVLPPLEVGDDGRAAAEFIIPEITDANQLWHRSLVVHGKDDARVACGVVD